MSHDLIGTWDLVSFVTHFEDGSAILPYGPNAAGRITYSKEGFMAAHLWDPDRHNAGSSAADPAYFSYCGSWSIDENTVRHFVHAATHPQWTNTVKLRTIRPNGSEIELIAEGVKFGGKTGRGVLLWRPWQGAQA